MKKWIPIAAALVLSALIAGLWPALSRANQVVQAEGKVEESLLPQQIETLSAQPLTVKKIYNAGKLVGVVSDYAKIEALLDEVYHSVYETDFPNTRLELGEDMIVTEELSYYRYENIDEALCAYLREGDLFSVETNRIDFSDENDVYATIYVKNLQDFYDARDQYLLNFVSKETLDTVRMGQSTPELKTYGTREVNIDVLEKMTVTTDRASSSNILKDKQEILHYLSYGAEPNLEMKYYTVVEGDMIDGVGTKNGLSAQQVVSINSDQLESVDQLIQPGMVLNVTNFQSPITVRVTKERVAKEEVYPEDPIYKEDPNMKEGSYVTDISAQNGSRNAFYEEVWINGENTSGTLVSSIITRQPIREETRVGTKVIPGVGTGTFRWPVDNPSITCRWGCYAGHQAIDIKNSYNRYGNLYAADRGTVVEASYSSINGYYQIIDHNNGYKTYYGHMNRPAFNKVGQNVEKGEIIGQIGMTGRATGPHVHFFIYEGSRRRNPCDGFLPC